MFIKYRLLFIILIYLKFFTLFIRCDSNNTTVEILTNLSNFNDINTTENDIQIQIVTNNNTDTDTLLSSSSSSSNGDTMVTEELITTEIPKNYLDLNLLNFSTTIPTTTTVTPTTETELQRNSNENNNNYPDKCGDEHEKLLNQPEYNNNVKIKKCCPYGEYLNDKDGNYCYTQNAENNFNVDVINVILYDKCIEDTEENISFEYKIGNPCNISYVYGSQHGDILYVIQNGSLLILDEFRNQSYQIENDYCLDIDYNTGDLYAIVCINSIYAHISEKQTILFSIFMICSIPCLLIVSYLHFIIKELRTLHGLSLGFLSLNLSIGFFLHSFSQILYKNIDDANELGFGHSVQFFILGYFTWLFILCLNVTITIWIFIPRYIVLPRILKYSRFGIYFCLSVLLPLIFVLITKYKGFNGMPSYFYQAWSESVQLSQRYFIPPVTILLVLCILLLITTYFGFNRIEKIIENQSIDLEMYRETKKDFRCITYLTIIIVTTWLFEIATFYLPSIGDYLVMMEIFNGLQGVFILMIFVVIRNRRDLIIRWWYDRGSLDIEMEMKNLNSNYK